MFKRHDSEKEEPQEYPVHLLTYTNYAEAALAAQQLQASGIAAIVLPMGAGGGFGSSALFAQEVRVLPSDLERARQILKTGERRQYHKHVR